MTRDEALAKLTAPGQPFELVETEAIGRKVLTFRNGPKNLREIFEATRSDKEFIVYENERYTYEDTWRLACTLAHQLVSQFGIRKGDTIAIAMRNYPEWMISYCAITSIGAVAVAVNALWTADEMAHGLTLSDPKVIIADQERIDRITSLPSPPMTLILFGISMLFGSSFNT